MRKQGTIKGDNVMRKSSLTKAGCAIMLLIFVSCRNDGATNVAKQVNDTAVVNAKRRNQLSKSKQPMAYVTSKDGTRIAFEKSGSGPAIIIVSGALSARSLFVGEPGLLVEMLAEHFTVYIYDRRGRGESTDEKPYAVQKEIEDLESLIDNAAGGEVFLYGVSSGAALSLHAAAKLGGSKVKKLAIFEPPYGQGNQAFQKQKQGVNDRIKNDKPGDAAEFFLSEIGTPEEVVEKMKSSVAWKSIEKLDFTLAYDYEILGDGAIPTDVVKAITIPALVMDGEKSMDFMHATAEQLTTLIPNAEHRTLKGQMHQAKAEAVAPLLIEFFK